MLRKTLLIVTIIFLFLETSIAQIVINRISPGGTIEFKNLGNTTVDVTNYHIVNWVNLSTRVLGATLPQCGNLMMEPGSTLTLHNFPGIKKESGTLNLHNMIMTSQADWENPDYLIDFVTWGQGNDLGIQVAVDAGIWTDGDFVPAFEDNECLTYSGTGNSSSSWSIVTNPVFCGFNLNPSTALELDNANRYLAERFAPVLFQFGAENDNTSGEFADIPTKVNYDGDWNHLNNWQHVHLVPEFSPSAYFDVAWTETLYIITYYYYFPRDYTKHGTLCVDEWGSHEGDGERVVVYIERDLLKVRGYTASNHSKADRVTCVDYSLDGSCAWTAHSQVCDNDDTPNGCYPLFFVYGSSSYYHGDHPVVYSSAGSHAIYELECHASEDKTRTSGTNNCRPTKDFMRAFTPGQWQSTSSSDFDNQYSATDWTDTSLPFEVTTYELIDVFSTDLSNGLWIHRNDENSSDHALFTEPESAFINNQGPTEIIPESLGYGSYLDYSKQRLICESKCRDEDNYENYDGAAAAAPWNGSTGLNILPYVTSNLNRFTCCDSDNTCEEIRDLHECEYLHNEYLCGTHRIKLTDAQQSGDDVDVTFKFLSDNVLIGSNVHVNWTITPADGWTCVGCSEGENIIVVTFIDAEFDIDDFPPSSDYSISATANLVECGTISDNFNVPVTNNLVIITGDCNEIVVKYDELKHVDGNMYDWLFFEYDELPITSNQNKKSTFSTSLVLDRYNILNSQTSNELPKIIPYELTITNSLNPSSQNETKIYGFAEIPDCLGSSSIVIYPNPTSDIIYTRLNGEILNEIKIPDNQGEIRGSIKGKSMFILNNSLQIVKEIQVTSFTETIDVSNLESGLYYLYTTTNNGEVISGKVVIAR